MLREAKKALAISLISTMGAAAHAAEGGSDASCPTIGLSTLTGIAIERKTFDLLATGGRLLNRDCKAHLKAAFESPAAQSKLLNALFKTDFIEFRVFDAKEEGEAASLGARYDYAASIQDHELEQLCNDETCVSMLDLSFSATGNIAFDEDTNPTDFLETKLSLDFFQSRGGVVIPSGEVLQSVMELRNEFVGADADQTDIDAIANAIVDKLRPYLSNQYYWSVGLEASLESNQRFTRKNYVFAAAAAVDLKGWSRDSALARFNLFDYPFALFRALTGYEDCSGGTAACFQPRGQSFPVFRVGLGRVDPSGSDPRSQLDDSDYTRLDAEVSFSTPLARIGDDTYYVSLNYRYFRELDPLASVEAADLDSFDYFSATLRLSDTIAVTYSDGKLPFDLMDQQVLALGWQTHF